jgi:DNA polymerase zeta
MQRVLKIETYNPKDVRTIKEILSNGRINRFKFKCYESHIPYLLHFYIDHNLFGMEQMDVFGFKFRKDGLPKLKNPEVRRKALYPEEF